MSKTSQHKEWTMLKEAMMNRHSKKLNVIMDSVDEEEFAVLYFKLLEFVQPKLQRREATIESTEDLQITVKYVKSLADENKEKGTSIISKKETDDRELESDTEL